MSRRVLATTPRWLLGASGLGGLAYAAVRWLPPWVTSPEHRIYVGLAGWATATLAFWFYLLGEESRLARELRVARTGTSVQRKAVLRRRRPAPAFVLMIFWQAGVRLLGAVASTSIGYAAVLLAEGDVLAAEAALGGASRFLPHAGVLGRLRAVVEADVLRARGTEEALGDAIRALYAMDPLEHLEAERYRVHVLVKALLEQADGATARSLAEELAQHQDEELHVYAVWLRAWFDLEHMPTPSDADTRLAILLARAHGADALVKRLEASIAPKTPP